MQYADAGNVATDAQVVDPSQLDDGSVESTFLQPGDLIPIGLGTRKGLQLLKILFGKGSADNLAVTFGRNANQVSHAFRHVDAAGLPRSQVQTAVQNSLRGVNLPVGKLHTGTVNAGGRSLQFNAFRLSDGTVNVGRITVD